MFCCTCIFVSVLNVFLIDEFGLFLYLIVQPLTIGALVNGDCFATT